MRRVIASIGLAPKESVKSKKIYADKGMRQTINSAGFTSFPAFDLDTNTSYMSLIADGLLLMA